MKKTEKRGEAFFNGKKLCANKIYHSKQEPLPHKFEWLEMAIAKNREEYGLIKTDLSKQKIEDKKS